MPVKDCSVLAEEKEKDFYMLVLGKNKEMKAKPSKGKTSYNAPLSEHLRMKWKINYAEGLGIIKAKTSGLMSWDDKKKLCEEMLTAGRNKNVKAFLVDHKETSFGLSILEIDSLPDMFRNIGFDFKDKMAILINPDSSNISLFNFLQDVFTLSALQVKVFTDHEEATAWLKKKI
jgi:hypothetical protein